MSRILSKYSAFAHDGGVEYSCSASNARAHRSHMTHWTAAGINAHVTRRLAASPVPHVTRSSYYRSRESLMPVLSLTMFLKALTCSGPASCPFMRAISSLVTSAVCVCACAIACVRLSVKTQRGRRQSLSNKTTKVFFSAGMLLDKRRETKHVVSVSAKRHALHRKMGVCTYASCTKLTKRHSVAWRF